MLGYLLLFFKIIIFISAMLVVCASNPVHSVLFLVLVFINTAFILMFLEADFMSLVLVVVYVGAIAVLFLFVCMMLSVRIEQESYSIYAYLPVSVVFGLVLIIELCLSFYNIFNNMISSHFGLDLAFDNVIYEVSNIRVLGDIVYTYYFLYFFLAAIALLLAMFGAIYLTLHHRDDVRRQTIYVQLAREYVLSKFK
jgi:NADH-quinone oxidoreductase subunit J